MLCFIPAFDIMLTGGVFMSDASLKRLNKGNRRPLQPLKWKDTKNKIKKDKGLKHKIVKGKKAGTTVPALTPPTGVQTCRCKKNGCKLPTESYVELFESFRDVLYDRQSQIIAGCIKIEDPVERTVSSEIVIKKHTYRYTLKLRGKEYAVCRQRLCDTFRIRPSRLRSIITKMEEGQLSFEDGRGKTRGVHCLLLTDEFKNQIRSHIMSFPTYESHYCRGDADADRRYLDEELNVTKMVSIFNEIQAANNGRLCKFDAYNDIFKKEFDLKFGLPRKDTCNFCDSHKALIARARSASERESIEQALELHREVASAARSMHKADGEEEDPNMISITADMQKVLFVPSLTCSSAYFKRKLSTFNLGIHQTGKPEAEMYIWDETIAEHTSKDVLSCLYKYIKDKFSKLSRRNVRKLILWSDRFVGQFNNCYLVLFMKYLVDAKYFSSVEHKFFVTGHSWMSCDRDFGLIEKRYKVMHPLVPKDIKDVITSARINNPFEIVEMNTLDFLNFGVLPQYVSLPSNLQVTKYHWFKYDVSSPNIVHAKPFHISANWQTFKLALKRPSGFLQLKTFPQSYTGPLQINEAKAKDLRDLMEKINDREKYNYYDDITKFVLH